MTSTPTPTDPRTAAVHDPALWIAPAQPDRARLRAEAQRILDASHDADLFAVPHAALAQPAVAFDIAAYMEADALAKRAAEAVVRS